jgi:hypothetical protein
MYPGHFVYLSFPIDERAVAMRWGMRVGRNGQLILHEETGPLDYVQGEIGSVSDVPGPPQQAKTILEHLAGPHGVQLFEPGGIACTEQLPPDTYTLKIESRLTNGAMRTDSVTFTVE